MGPFNPSRSAQPVDQTLQIMQRRQVGVGRQTQPVGHLQHPWTAQPGAPDEIRIAQQLNRICLSHTTIDHDGDHIRPRQCEVDVMGGQHDRGVLPLQPFHRREQVADTGRVESGGRFVQKQETRTHRDRAGDRCPLALAERQPVYRTVGELGDRQQLQCFADSGRDLGLRKAEIQRTERDVPGDVRGEQLVVRVLQHELHLLAMPSKTGTGVLDRAIVEQHPTGRRTQGP